MSNKPQPITEMFGQNSNLERLNQHITQITELETKLRKILPPHLGTDYTWCIGNFRDQHLILFADSPAHASKLRFQQQLIQEKIQLLLPNIVVTTIKVRYQTKEQTSMNKTGRKLSAGAAAQISASAEHINDRELRAALLRLSQRSVKR